MWRTAVRISWTTGSSSHSPTQLPELTPPGGQLDRNPATDANSAAVINRSKSAACAVTAPYGENTPNTSLAIPMAPAAVTLTAESPSTRTVTVELEESNDTPMQCHPFTGCGSTREARVDAPTTRSILADMVLPLRTLC